MSLPGLCSSTPRGDGNKPCLYVSPWATYKLVYAAQPREGTETAHDLVISVKDIEHGLCSSTPRGDGNRVRLVVSGSQHISVYAAQPREGTETDIPIFDVSPHLCYRFMQLNPARGRKLWLMALATRLGIPVYAAQPREGTETTPI